jgi:hypothetical protein
MAWTTIFSSVRLGCALEQMDTNSSKDLNGMVSSLHSGVSVLKNTATPIPLLISSVTRIPTFLRNTVKQEARHSHKSRNNNKIFSKKSAIAPGGLRG